MNEKLWALVQEFVDKAHVGNAELAVAGANLDSDVSSIFTKHMSKISELPASGPAEWL